MDITIIDTDDTTATTPAWSSTFTAGVAVFEEFPFTYVSSEAEGVVWCCGHHHRTEDAAFRCLPRAEREADERNAAAQA